MLVTGLVFCILSIIFFKLVDIILYDGSGSYYYGYEETAFLLFFPLLFPFIATINVAVSLNLQDLKYINIKDVLDFKGNFFRTLFKMYGNAIIISIVFNIMKRITMYSNLLGLLTWILAIYISIRLMFLDFLFLAREADYLNLMAQVTV